MVCVNKYNFSYFTHQPCIDSRSRVGLDCQKRSEEYSPVLPFRNDSDQSGLCSKLSDMRSVGDIDLNPLLRKVNKVFTVSYKF